MLTYWFKPKRYGYGATPVTWQGWALTFETVLAVVAVSLSLRLTARSPWALSALVLFDAAAVAMLVIVKPQDRRRMALALGRSLERRATQNNSGVYLNGIA